MTDENEIEAEDMTDEQAELLGEIFGKAFNQNKDEEIQPTAETAYTKLTTKIKRGTGTRDQDTTKVVTRHPDPNEAGVRHQKAIESARSAANAARTIQTEKKQ